MPTYYVFRPNFDVTAEVDAPNTKHARTTYLDYLARNNLIAWSDRGRVRKETKVTRMEPGESETTVQLHYGFKEAPEVELPPPMVERPAPDEEIAVGPTYEDLGPAPEEKEFEEGVAPTGESQGVFGPSPIMDLSRKTGGL